MARLVFLLLLFLQLRPVLGATACVYMANDAKPGCETHDAGKPAPSGNQGVIGDAVSAKSHSCAVALICTPLAPSVIAPAADLGQVPISSHLGLLFAPPAPCNYSVPPPLHPPIA